MAFAIRVVVLGALISLLQVLKADWVPFLTAALIRCCCHHQPGGGYPTASRRDLASLPQGRRRHERADRLYLNNAYPYAAVQDEASAYRLLVERVETIIAEEQQLFWHQAKGGAQQEPAKAPDQGT